MNRRKAHRHRPDIPGGTESVCGGCGDRIRFVPADESRQAYWRVTGRSRRDPASTASNGPKHGIPTSLQHRIYGGVSPWIVPIEGEDK